MATATEELFLSTFENNLESMLVAHARHRRSPATQSPLVFIPEEGGKQCRPANSISSIGYLALVTSVLNAVLQASNNINNNNNNRNNNNNDVNNNNNNVNVANLASMQMNMNMVMVGRQLEHLKKDQQRLMAKMEAKEGEKPSPGNDWMSNAKLKLSNMLDDIPASEEKRPTTGGSLWDFWNALNGVLFRSRAKRAVNAFCAVDAVYFGLTYVDFWMSSTTMLTDENRMAIEFCTFARGKKAEAKGNSTLEKMDAILMLAAAKYMQQMTSERISSAKLMQAADYGRSSYNNSSGCNRMEIA